MFYVKFSLGPINCYDSRKNLAAFWIIINVVGSRLLFISDLLKYFVKQARIKFRIMIITKNFHANCSNFECSEDALIWFFLNKKGNILDLLIYDTTIDCTKPYLHVIVKIIKKIIQIIWLKLQSEVRIV